MVTSRVIANSLPPRLMVHGPNPPLHPGSLPGILKSIVFALLSKFALLIASRREQCDTRQAPLSRSSVVVTVSVAFAVGPSSLIIVRVAGLGPLNVALPVGLDSVMLTVSF